MDSRMRLTFIIAGLCLALSTTVWSDDARTGANRPISPWSSQIWKTRPVRRDLPLRQENITDNEVREIEAVMQEMFPGSVVYISAVTTGCPCEDGPDCTDQVWSVAFRDGVNSELALSRIDGEWQIGPLQDWWLIRDRIEELFRSTRGTDPEQRRISFNEYMRRMDEHNLAFPFCSAMRGSEEA